MKKTLLFCLVAMLYITACSKDDSSNNLAFSNESVKAFIENFYTKTLMDHNTVVWEEGDAISIFGSDGNNYEYVLNEEYINQSEGIFQPSDESPTTLIAALYPYNGSATFDNNTITTTIAKEFTWAENSNNKAAMATVVANDGDIIFKNAGSLLAITVNNIPSEYNHIVLTSVDDEPIAGAAEIKIDDGKPSVTVKEGGSNTIKINFGDTDIKNKTFYFPIPEGEYTKLDVIMYNDEESKSLTLISKSRNIAANTRYYASINLSNDGKLPTEVENVEELRASIDNGDRNFELGNELSELTVSNAISDDMYFSVNSSSENFSLSGENLSGNIYINTPNSTKNLTLNLPNGTVEIKSNSGKVTYDKVIAATAENTLIIPKGVHINELIINKGNVKVYGSVGEISRGESNDPNKKTTIYKEIGGIIPEDLSSDNFIVIDLANVPASPFAGGDGTQANPYLIETVDQLTKISEYFDTYNYFKIANGVTTLDLTGIGKLKLNGSFDGNGVTINNLSTSLFEIVGDITKEQKIKISNLTANVHTTDGRALVRNILNPGETTFENVTLHGYIEGQYNMGSFYNYGTANNSINDGANYTVNFINTKSDATLVCTTGNSIGGMLGHGFEGSSYKLTINMDEESGYSGTMYTTGTAKCYKVMAMCSHATYYLNGVETSRYANEYPSTKLAVSNPIKREDGYYVDPVDGVNHYVVYLNSQLTAYDNNNNKIDNLSGMTWNLGKIRIDSNFEGVIFAQFNSAEIINDTNHNLGYSIENGVLKIYSGRTKKYLSGWVTLQVNQYDSKGNLLSTGNTTVWTFPEPQNN